MSCGTSCFTHTSISRCKRSRLRRTLERWERGGRTRARHALADERRVDVALQGVKLLVDALLERLDEAARVALELDLRGRVSGADVAAGAAAPGTAAPPPRARPAPRRASRCRPCALPPTRPARARVGRGSSRSVTEGGPRPPLADARCASGTRGSSRGSARPARPCSTAGRSLPARAHPGACSRAAPRDPLGPATGAGVSASGHAGGDRVRGAAVPASTTQSPPRTHDGDFAPARRLVAQPQVRHSCPFDFDLADGKRN